MATGHNARRMFWGSVFPGADGGLRPGGGGGLTEHDSDADSDYKILMLILILILRF